MEYNNINSVPRSVVGLFMRAISEVLFGKELRPIDPFGFPDCFLSSGVLDTSACLIKGVNDRAGNADIETARLTFESSRNEVS